jgi:hypothetical protein
MKEEKYCGLEMVLSTHHNTDKTQKLSLVYYNLRESDTNNVSIPNNHLCTVRPLNYHLENNLPLYWTGLLFLKKVTAQVLSLCKTMGITYIVDTDPSSSTNSTSWGKVACSFLTSQVCKLAKVYWKECTAW